MNKWTDELMNKQMDGRENERMMEKRDPAMALGLQAQSRARSITVVQAHLD